MDRSRPLRHPVGMGLIVIASILLLGTVLLGVGYFGGHRVAFYAGLFVTLAGVLPGIQRITRPR